MRRCFKWLRLYIDGYKRPETCENSNLSTTTYAMPNELVSATSQYLLDHANDLVEWQEWGEAALEVARSANKPILLTIGYRGCRGCEAMARESFCNPSVAAVMNERFINIKVDRDERPDLDKVYQSALQLIVPKSGGWPLTVFLEPDSQLPFFGGSYFPQQAQQQMPGFQDLLLRIIDSFDNKREELDEQSQKLSQALDQLTPPVLDPGVEDFALLEHGRGQLLQQHDSAQGGFGKSVKFPMPARLLRLLRHWAYSRRRGDNDRESLDAVMTTLTKIARGGIHDHIAGGLFSYAHDSQWMVPTFEKKLYDNAQMLPLLAAALTLGDDDLFASTLASIVDWMRDNLLDTGGAFFAGEDGESGGQNGQHYLWRREQLKKLLGEDEYLLVETLFGLDKLANIENRWNLHRHDSYRSVVERLSLTSTEADALLASAKQKMRSARAAADIQPTIDRKVITGWNGLAIKGLADAGRSNNQGEWIAMAGQCAQFLRQSCWDGEMLYSTWHESRLGHPAFLDDYANVLGGLHSLLQCRWDDDDAAFARQLADVVLSKFYDNDDGGFYFAPMDVEPLIYAPKPTLDETLPPGNATLALVLNRLGLLFGEQRYLDAAANTLRWARAVMEHLPTGHCGLLTALEDALLTPQAVILRGPDADMTDWLTALQQEFAPWRCVYAIPYSSTAALPSFLPKLVSTSAQSSMSAFIYDGSECSPVITDLTTLRQQIA